MNYHVGEWISVRAQAERTPPRFTVTVTLGELPEGWSLKGNRVRTWSGVVGLALLSPFIALLLANLLRAAGIGQPYEWLANSTTAILAATISLFVGIPVAIAMNVWRITRVGLHRRAGALEGLVALELAPLHLIVVFLALLVGGLFVGHLAADSYACMNGVRSAC